MADLSKQCPPGATDDWTGAPVASLGLPAVVLSCPGTLAQVKELSRRLCRWEFSTVFLQDSVEGMAPLVVSMILEQNGMKADLGLCLHGRDKNGIALDCDIRTAAELGFRYVFLKEPDFRIGRVVNSESTLSIIRRIRDALSRRVVIVIENSFMHPSDIRLLESQFRAGADLVASRMAELPVTEQLLRFKPRFVPLRTPEPEAKEADRSLKTAVVDLSEFSHETMVKVGDRVLL